MLRRVSFCGCDCAVVRNQLIDLESVFRHENEAVWIVVDGEGQTSTRWTHAFDLRERVSEVDFLCEKKEEKHYKIAE